MRIKRVRLFVNKNKRSEQIANTMTQLLKQQEIEVVTGTDFELAISVGGYGAFLRMVKMLRFRDDILYIGINSGTLGFLQEVSPDELDSFVFQLKQGQYSVEKVGIQKTDVFFQEKKKSFFTLNEIVVRDGNLNTIRLHVFINDSYLQRFVGDGLLLSTTVGSTAYNLSFGGSIVLNQLHTLQLTPIAPLNSNSYRVLQNSFVVPECTVVKMVPESQEEILISVDGDNYLFQAVSSIQTVIGPKQISCMRLDHYNFVERIYDKFLADVK